MVRSLVTQPSGNVLKLVYPVLAGCCVFLAFESYNFFPALFLLPFFLNGMRRLPMKSRLPAFWLMAVITNVGGFGWIRFVATDYGGMPVPVALGLVLLFALFNNLNFVLWAYLEHFFGDSKNPFKIAALFCVAEQVNPQVFPWYFGTALDSALVFYQTADIWGVIGLSFVLMVLIHLPWWIWANRSALLKGEKVAFISQIIFVGFLLIYGNWALRKYSNKETARGEKTVAISLIQSNTGLEKFYGEHKSIAERVREFRGLLAISEEAIRNHSGNVDLVVWPEGAVHFPILTNKEIFAPLANLAKKQQVSVAAGSVESVGKKANGRWEYYNTQFVFSPAGTIQGKYRKIILLAFGEYIPLLENFTFLEEMLPKTISHFSRGREKPLFPLGNNVHWLPLICYEDIVSGFMAGFDHKRADFIVNTTNDGWFGKSDASHLHKQMARVRTVEYRKPMVRALNTGVSLLIDAAGRTISRETDLYTKEYINATLHLPQTPPVTLFSIIGNWPIYFAIFFAAVFWARGIWGRRR